MQFEMREKLDPIAADAIVIGIVEGSSGVEAEFSDLAGPHFENRDLPLKPNEMFVVPGKPRTVFVGIGKSADAEAWRRGAAAVIRNLKNVKRVGFVNGDAGAIAEGAVVGSFAVEVYKTSNERRRADTVIFAGADSKAVTVGKIVGESINWARQLIIEPSNRKPPRIVAERAKAMAADVGLSAVILTEREIRDLKMGALLGVSQGSEEPPRMVILRHMGKPDSKRLLAYVGKGITFDTGGISLKPADGMEKMKYDMAGGATAMAALRSIALMRMPINCLAVVPLAENMPSGRAQRPGDVVEAMSGKTIEIINTDAEGRLVLADGLAYARHLGATHIVDLATLTGACRIALGAVRAAVLGNRQEFVDSFLDAAKCAGEKMWQLPLDDEYREMIRSSIADVANSGGRFGGVITAAKFLQEFVADVPWVHIDIAGTAWNDEEKPYLSKGPSGVAVRSLVEFAARFGESGDVSSL